MRSCVASSERSTISVRSRSRAWAAASDRSRRSCRSASARARASATSAAKRSTAAARSVAASDASSPEPPAAPIARLEVARRTSAATHDARYLAFACKGRGPYHRWAGKRCLQRFFGRLDVQPSGLAARLPDLWPATPPAAGQRSDGTWAV